MRNLKKILALVLALVMSLSLMATAGASSFPDVDAENPYATAIEVLDELKVFQGYKEDGTFRPTETLNRAQAAVLVYRIATGDVEDKYLDNYTYMQQSKFTDLDGYNWAKGYINYCQNAGIVVGTSATTFNPGAPVTGYQLMVMLLRTLGYGKAGEFTDPKGWELQTAAIAEREGILKNVTGGDFGAPAPRQMVAEILFRGLLHDTVAYSPLTPGGYTNSGETLGKKNLGLEDIKGVVMANEFADLEDDDTLADGKTRLDVDGKVYNLDIKSELTDIGEIRHAYVQNGTKVLTTLENLNDSTVNQPENGKGSKVSDLSKVNGDTQYFLNFGPVVQDESEWRIEYNVEFTTASETGDTPAEVMANFEDDYCKLADAGMKEISEYKYTKAIKPGTKISANDLKVIRGIFDLADGGEDPDGNINKGVIGSVFAGANSQSSTNRNKNLAVEMTYSQFVRDYITNENDPLKESDNGEWLKTIDNNGDGVADYVFLTTFVMSVIDDYNTKNETYYVEFDADTKRDTNSTIKKSAVVTEDELKIGDVILYTWIDGKCYVSHPEVDVKAIDKKGIDYKAKTITCGDTTYDWSGIEQEAYHYYHDVSEANVEVNYNLYKDHFGYVRLFAEANKGFVLLTDGFYATDLKKDHTYKAEMWDVTADDFAEIDVANDNFINTVIDSGSNRREEGTWDRLKAFEESYSNHVQAPAQTYVTTIAAYDVNGDGVYSLSDVDTYTGRYAYTQHELDIDSFDKGSVKDKDLKATTGHTGDHPGLNRINATDETLYYYVKYNETNKRLHNEIVDVDTWTGYSNGSVKLVKGDRAYAVTLCYRDANDKNWLNYETAEIIVIEHEISGETNTVLPVNLTQRLIGRNNEIGGEGFVWDDETGNWIFGDFEAEAKSQAPSVRSLELDANSLTPVDISDLLRFYDINDDKMDRIPYVDEDNKLHTYGDSNIYAGVIITRDGSINRNYGEIALAEGKNDTDVTKPLPDHDFKKASDNFYAIGYSRSAAEDDDEMLRVPGLQETTLVGDVASTFSADQLDYVDMERGDKVIYVTNGDGVVQSIINVTKSRMNKNYDPDGIEAGRYPGVYKGDKHSTSEKYSETYTLLTLWEEIADSQAAVDSTNAPVVKFYGVEDNQAGDTNSTVGTITVSHATAKAATNANFLTVEGGNWTITPAAPESTDAVSTSAQTWTLSIYGDDEQWYTYTLVLNAQGTAGELIVKKNDYGFAIRNGKTLVFSDPNATLNLLKNYLDCTGKPESKVDLASVKGYYGGVEKNSDDKLTEMDEIRVNVVNSDGDINSYVFKTADGTLLKADFVTLVLQNNVKAYDVVTGDEYADGAQIPSGNNVRFEYPVAYADADAPDTATPFIVNATKTAADGRGGDGSDPDATAGMLYIVRTVTGTSFTVGFNTATLANGTFTWTAGTNVQEIVPNSGDTALEGHDGVDYFIYAKPDTNWLTIGQSGLTATGVANWITIAAGTGKTPRGSWDDFDEGKFHYTAEGQNGGTTQRTYFEFITLKTDEMDIDDNIIDAIKLSDGSEIKVTYGATKNESDPISIPSGLNDGRLKISDLVLKAGVKGTPVSFVSSKTLATANDLGTSVTLEAPGTEATIYVKVVSENGFGEAVITLKITRIA